MNKIDKIVICFLTAMVFAAFFIGYFSRVSYETGEAKKRPVKYEVQIEELPQKGDLLQVLDITHDTVWIGYTGIMQHPKVN